MKQKNKVCCVIGHYIMASKDSYRLLVKSEIEKAITQGYTKFITYYKSDINILMMEEVTKLKNTCNEPLSIELVYISSRSIKYFLVKKRKYAESLCDSISIIADKNDVKGKEEFCKYLTSKCDKLLCFEEDFRFEAGRYNAKILNAFKEQGHTISVFKL